MTDWWEAAPLADAPSAPAAGGGGKWWESAPVVDEARPKRDVSDAFRPAVGASRAVASMAGAPLDAASWMVNNAPGTMLVNKGAEALGFKPPIPKIPAVAEDFVKKHVMLANPDDVRPAETTGEKLLEAAGEGAASMAVPGMGAEMILARTMKAGESFGNMALNILKGSGATSNTVMGAAGSVGGEVAAEQAPDWLKPTARLAGGVLGGVGGAAGLKIGGLAKEPAHSVARPFTAGGREEIAGRALNKIADDPAKAISNMENYSQDVPSFQITAAKASRDDSLMATENALSGPGTGFGQRVNSNNEKLTAALDALDAGGDPKKFVAELSRLDTEAASRAQAALDLLPAGADAAAAGQAIQQALRGRFEGLIDARSAATKPLYEEARNDPTRMKPFPLLVSTADAVAASKGDLKTTAQKVRALLFDADGKADRTVGGMMATRDAINDMMSSASPKQQRMLIGFRDQVDEALSIVPPEILARRTYAEMSRPLDSFSADKGAPFAAGVVEKDEFGKHFMMPVERVPTQFFKPGDAGAATMKEFLAANAGNPEALGGVKAFIAEKARSADDIGSFLQKHGPAIETLDPALARQLEGATAARNISEGFRASPAGKFIESDTDAATRLALNAPDSVKRMQALRTVVGENPEAVQGLQRAVINDFRKAALASVAQDAERNPRLIASTAANWLEANRDAASTVLTKQQVAGLEAITTALADQAQTAVKVAGSDTTRNLATLSILEALIGRRAADAAFLGPLRKTLNLVYGDANEKVLKTLTDAMLDPSVATALMRRAAPGNAKLAGYALGRTAITTAAATEGRPDNDSGRR